MFFASGTMFLREPIWFLPLIIDRTEYKLELLLLFIKVETAIEESLLWSAH